MATGWYPVDGEWHDVQGKIIQFKRAGLYDKAEALMQWIDDFAQCPVAHFIPHGRKWSDQERIVGNGAFTIPPSCYDKKYGNDGVAFLSDRTHDSVMFLAPNQAGKTQIGAIKSILEIIPCDKSWPIFTRSGVEWHEWTGPKVWVISSYSFSNVITLWSRYRDWLPRSELQEYSPNWGKYPGEKGKAKEPSLGSGKPIRITLACGSVIIPLCYGQQQCHWESFESDGIHADEQMPKEKFIGWKRSTTTRGNYTPMIVTFTGHILDDRSDTGAAGWMHREVWNNPDQYNAARYGTGIDDVPDALITKEMKKKLYDQWANPAFERSEHMEREGVARYWGGWQVGGGMVFPEFKKSIHVIPPIWKDNKPPADWTKVRVIDYADSGVTCCSWFAVGPGNVAICYQVMYERNLVVYETVEQIIMMSGNKMSEVGTEYDELTRVQYTIYEELETESHFEKTLIDSRSGAQLKNGVSLIDLFTRYGLRVEGASGAPDKQQVPLLRDLLRVDYGRDHIMKKENDGTMTKGAAMLYFVDGYTDMAIHEIENLCLDTGESERLIAKGQDDHAVDTLKYFASEGVTYQGDQFGENATAYDGHIPTPYTGY